MRRRTADRGLETGDRGNRRPRWRLAVFALAVLTSGCGPDAVEAGGAAPVIDPPGATTDSVADWSAAFQAEGAVGTFVLLDTETGRTTRHDPARAAARLTPASTSKIWNSLVFLDRGVVTDPDSIHAWDGVERRISSWNRDHSLRTGIEVSALWLFQRLALEVGRDGYDTVFATEPYGNSTMGEPLQMAWLDGSLRISADEQVAFLDRLRRGDLAFAPEHQATVREIVPVLAGGAGGTLKAKTGWALRDGEPDLGWLVGWVERPEGDVVFAMNAQAAPGATLASADLRFDVGPGRLRIVRAVLEGEGVWPVEGDGAP